MLQMVWISEEMHNQNKSIGAIHTVCIVYVMSAVCLWYNLPHSSAKCISRYYNYIVLGTVHMWGSCRNKIYIQKILKSEGRNCFIFIRCGRFILIFHVFTISQSSELKYQLLTITIIYFQFRQCHQLPFYQTI